jgi:hypothetical protein
MFFPEFNIVYFIPVQILAALTNHIHGLATVIAYDANLLMFE